MFAMEEITHNNLPEALTEIRKDVSEILKLHRQFYNTQKQPDLPDILDIKQAAELLGYKVSSCYSMVNRKILPAKKIKGSKKLFFSRAELLEILQRKETRAETEQRANDYVVKR
jgi:predicted DNA-binding transcriptional regulator AlpA